MYKLVNVENLNYFYKTDNISSLFNELYNQNCKECLDINDPCCAIPHDFDTLDIMEKIHKLLCTPCGSKFYISEI